MDPITISNALLLLVVIYFNSMFVLSQIFIPNLGYRRKIKGKIPIFVRQEMIKIGENSKTKREVLEKVLEFQHKYFYSEMRQVYRQFFLLFEGNFQKLWNKKGFLHCHQQNFVLRVLLLQTKRFKEEDIRLKVTFCYFNIHQYMKLKVDDETIKVDPFAISLGYHIGEVLPNFAYKSMKQRKISPFKTKDKSKAPAAFMIRK